MKNLGLSALSVGSALVCAMMPLSFHSTPTMMLSISVDQAEARLGQRPSIARKVAGVGRRAQRPGAVLNPTGRWCTTQPSGYQWCWTP
jgi:hypothetical protein